MLNIRAVQHLEALGRLSRQQHPNAVQPVRPTVLFRRCVSFLGSSSSIRVTADGENSANLTNLAIKGIVGVKAMAEISRALQQDNDAQFYDVRPVQTLLVQIAGLIKTQRML